MRQDYLEAEDQLDTVVTTGPNGEVRALSAAAWFGFTSARLSNVTMTDFIYKLQLDHVFLFDPLHY